MMSKYVFVMCCLFCWRLTLWQSFVIHTFTCKVTHIVITILLLLMHSHNHNVAIAAASKLCTVT